MDTLTMLALPQFVDAENLVICGVRKPSATIEETSKLQILEQLIAIQNTIIQLSSMTDLKVFNLYAYNSETTGMNYRWKHFLLRAFFAKLMNNQKV